MRYKAVIFDLDGTLLDTIEDIKETMNRALRKYGYKEYSLEEYKYFVGKGVDHLIRRTMEEGNIPDEKFLDIKNAYFEIYKDQSKVNTGVYEGINDLLKELKKTGVKLAVLSNKPHVQTIDVINYYFDDCVFNYVYGKKDNFLPKPDPNSALDLIGNLGVKQEEVLYVGDTETDILTSKNAKFCSVGVLWGFRKKDELVNAGADFIVEKPLEILDLID
ncbi:MAG: HAD family hydrolase [Candidatus Izemoplasmatales bacterium]|nr:HAD family hydrolase [Candidatus Izemoplasmatales bacterium]